MCEPFEVACDYLLEPFTRGVLGSGCMKDQLVRGRFERADAELERDLTLLVVELCGDSVSEVPAKLLHVADGVVSRNTRLGVHSPSFPVVAVNRRSLSGKQNTLPSLAWHPLATGTESGCGR